MQDADYRWQQELEEERIATTMAAIERAIELGLEPEHVYTLISETGLTKIYSQAKVHHAQP